MSAECMEADFATDRHPERNTKLSQIAMDVTSIALSLGHLRPQLRCIPLSLLIETTGTRTNLKFLFFFLSLRIPN